MPVLAIPERITPRWIAATVPTLAPHEIDKLVLVLDEREWLNRDGLASILKAISNR
jgi:hypothetical protein